tara:strand:- start:16234 stop:16437 length:204 start_codon:yes stop_codon:yes gene_type:complete
LSTETVKKAVGIMNIPLKFNALNKIKHYLLIFLKTSNRPKPRNFFEKCKLFLKKTLYKYTVWIYSAV